MEATEGATAKSVTGGRCARIVRISVTDFRNIGNAELHLPADGIAVVGDNGHGKTNLLEAIAYLQLLRSMRGARDRDLVRFDCDAFHVGADTDGTRVTRVGIGVAKTSAKRATLDGVEQTRLGSALGAVPSVCFSPADVSLVTGGPSDRRRALDIVLALTDHAYLTALRAYRAALTRRNATLRSSRQNHSSLHAWEPALAQHGAKLVRARHAWVAEFGHRFAALAAAIGEPQPMAVTYESAFGAHDDVASEIADALAASRDQDIRRGATQCGPHRDDLRFVLGARSLKVAGSAGQHRTAAIALRLLEAGTFRTRTGVQPIVLLDDPFAELDRRRADRVLALLQDTTADGLGQVVLCVPREDEVPREFTRLERWTVRDGEFAKSVSRG
ncbi:MAG: DNA replication and repair protein RecF [Gemmatimonadetes bacterium]|nr:DNA replication and repair protein RecF [Gemmatimonadota bacterium]